MKQDFYARILWIFLLFWWVLPVQGQLVLNYEFTGLNVGSNLAGQDGWIKGSTGPDPIVQNTNPLTYAGYNGGGGNYVQSPAGNATSSRVYKSFTSTAIGTNTIFYSFLLRVSAVTTGTSGNYFISLGDPGTGTNYFARVAATQGTNSSKFRIGGAKLANTFTWSTNEFDINTTYLVVVKYVSVSGNNNDEMYIWVNPSLSLEPTNTTADVTVSPAGADPTITDVGNFHWHNRNVDNATVAFDGVRVAFGANSASAWANLGIDGSLTATPVSLSGFSTINGNASSSQTYSLSGLSLSPTSGSITITAPTNFEISTDNISYGAAVNISYTGGVLSSTNVYVRISASAPVGAVSGDIIHSGGGINNPPVVSVNGTVNPPPIPFLNVTPASLTGFSTMSGMPSASQTYTLNGGNLSPPSGNITITAPTNFEVSTDNTTYGATINVPYTGGTLGATTIYVRISATAPVGAVGGNVTHVGGSVTTPPQVAVSGTVTPAFTPVYEPFTGTGNLNAYNGWVVHSGTADQVKRIAGNLSYPGLLPPTGNKIEIKAGDSEDLNKDLGMNLTGDVYYSAIIKVLNTTNMTTAGDYFLHFGATAGSSVTIHGARLQVRATGASTFNLGILNQSGGPASPTFISTNYDVGTSYFVVVKYNTSSNTASLWVNPVVGGPEPTPDVTNNTGTNVTAQVRSICIRQAGIGSTTTGNIEIDEVRVGTTWAQVTPANPNPYLYASSTTLTGFSTDAGTPSSSQIYTLTGGNLSPASGNITVTAPSNFEVSLNNTTFSSSLSIPYSSGNLSATTIYVRIAASASVGSVSGNIVNSGGSASETVSVSGVVNPVFVPIYEPFAGTGALRNYNGWQTHSGTNDQVQRVVGKLNFPGLERATGNKIQLLSTYSEDLNKDLGTTITSGSVYASFVMRVSDVSKFQANTALGEYFMHFADQSGTTFSSFQFSARLYIRQGSAPNKFQLGILRTSGGTTTANDIYGTSPMDLDINTNYFIVIKYTFGATPSASLFINPVPGAPEPTPTRTVTLGTAAVTQIQSICIRNANSSNIGTGDIEIDELRVGTTWAQVTPPNTTTPYIDVNPASLDVFTTSAGSASSAQSYVVNAGLLTSDLVITAPAGFEIKKSTDATYANSISITPVGGNVPHTTINVRLSASNANPAILIADINHQSGIAEEIVAVKGVVNATLPSFPDTPKGELSTPLTYTFSAIGLTEDLVITNNDNQNYSLSKDGTNFLPSITFTPAEVNGNNVTISLRFEPKSSVNGLKPVNIEHSANELTATASTEGRQLEPLAISEELSAQTLLFPNPASKFVQIQAKSVYQVCLQDVTGRTITQFRSDELLNVESLPNGLYFLQFSNERVKFVKRLLIQK